MAEFTHSEAARRYRVLTSQMREQFRLPLNMRIEVQVRKRPFVSATPPVNEYRHAGDDLEDSVTLKQSRALTQLREHGVVVHVAFYSSGYWGGLEEVCVGWLGTPDHEPMLLGQ